MAEVLPVNFPVPGASSIASYDFGDIISGTAYELMYLGHTYTDSANGYALNPNAFYSHLKEINTAIDPNTASYAKIEDLDFDIVCNLPRIIYGTLLVNCHYAVRNTTGGGTAGCYLIIKLRKYDGSTETDIASLTTIALETGVAETYDYLTAMQKTISTPQHFAIGDIIRVTVEVWGKNTHAADTHHTHFAIDPANRAGTYITENTKFEVYIPFKPTL